MQKRAKIVTHKGKGDFALNADIASEKYILQRIKKAYPAHDILTEETGHHHKQSDYLWIIDPLEGTLNYAHHIPFWGVNVGLFYKNKPYLGVVYLPELNELFHAAKGKGAYLNGKKIHVSTETRLKFHGVDAYGHGPGSIIVLEAGGKITDAQGKPWNLKSDGAIATNGKIHRKLLHIIKPLL